MKYLVSAGGWACAASLLPGTAARLPVPCLAVLWPQVVTGGVVSGLGKGISISSIGVLLKSCGLRVTSIKIDPYLVRAAAAAGHAPVECVAGVADDSSLWWARSS